MTLGKKLSRMRALADLTQGQLGEKLSVSPQAISKWENDLAEPDLATLRKLAELYHVSLEELLTLEEEEQEQASDAPTQELEEAPAAPVAETPAPAPVATPIGFCKDCGVTVTEENLGQKSPVVLCKKCVEARKAAAAREAAAKKAREEAAQRETAARKEGKRAEINRRRAWSFSIAGIVTAAFIALVVVLMGEFSFPMVAVIVLGGYIVFSFVHCLFYDCWVQEVVVDWFSKSINWPGLIFEFDVDGCLWYIGMKILFFLLGMLFGIVVGSIGITLGLIIAPFVFPYVLVKLHQAYVAGVDTDLL